MIERHPPSPAEKEESTAIAEVSAGPDVQADKIGTKASRATRGGRDQPNKVILDAVEVGGRDEMMLAMLEADIQLGYTYNSQIIKHGAGCVSYRKNVAAEKDNGSAGHAEALFSASKSPLRRMQQVCHPKRPIEVASSELEACQISVRTPRPGETVSYTESIGALTTVDSCAILPSVTDLECFHIWIFLEPLSLVRCRVASKMFALRSRPYMAAALLQHIVAAGTALQANSNRFDSPIRAQGLALAIQMVASSENIEAIEGIASCMLCTNVKVRIAVVSALKHFTSSYCGLVITAVSAFLQHANPLVRISVADALAMLVGKGHRQVIDSVLQCLVHESAAVRHSTGDLLGRVVDRGDDVAVAAVLRYMSHDDLNTRYAASMAAAHVLDQDSSRRIHMHVDRIEDISQTLQRINWARR